MRESAASQAPHRDDPAWLSISRYTIGSEDAAFSFAARLTRENGWSRDHADRVIEEYKRFCFLAVTAGHEVTPSDAVDQAWHLHLTYSRDYWERFCPEVLGRPLHHGPTSGGAAEHNRYYDQYAETLRSYERAFGTPPADIWPEARRRFLHDPQARRVHVRDVILLPRSIVRRIAIAVLLAGAIAVAYLVFT